MSTEKKVLVIEDNEQNMYLMQFLLEKHGYTVITANDGLQGAEAAAREKPDIILLDIQLPEMDGYEVARKLRSNANLAETPIIAVTSHAMVGDRAKCISAGATDYVEKPIDPEGLVERIRAQLKDTNHKEGET